MKIAVCFKLIEDYDQLSDDAWRTGALFRRKSGIMEAKLISKNFGIFDEAALETALRLKDVDPNVKLEAISLGQEINIFTENLYALGYDAVTYLQGSSDFDSQNTAKELASYIEKQDFDLILMGESVGPMNSGSVPYLMANRLDCNIVGNVTELSLQEEGLVLLCESNEAVERYLIGSASSDRAVSIAVVSNAKYPYLRLASYEKRKASKNNPAKKLRVASGKWSVKFETPLFRQRRAEYIDKEGLAEILLGKINGERT